MQHAVRHFLRRFDMEEGLVMFIGPDRVGRLVEVGVSDRTGEPLIVHAMPARSQFLEA